MTYDYPFTAEEMQAAYDEWGCNCGPASLAFALQIGLDKVRGAIPGFEEKRYTSPTMMRAGVENLGRKFTNLVGHPDMLKKLMFSMDVALVRIQWTGPWTKTGANPKWAYRQTHWTACYRELREHGWDGEMGVYDKVFDINGGIRSFDSWQKEIVPTLTALYPRADGGWYPTHVWRIDQ